MKTKKGRSGVLSRTFEALVRIMPPMAIHDDVQHGNVVERIDELMQVERLSKGQADYLETLVELVEAYELRRHEIDGTGLTGLQMLRHVMREAEMSGSDLARLLGMHATMGSKMLQGDRKVTWAHAKKLGAHFKVGPGLFLD